MLEVKYSHPIEALLNQFNIILNTDNSLPEIMKMLGDKYPEVKFDTKKISEIIDLLRGNYPSGSLFKDLEKSTDLKVNSYGFDEKVYSQLLARTELACILEKNTGAKMHAYKLAVIFGDVKPALEYLASYYKENHNLSSQAVHDACLFEVPQNDKWDLFSWRQLAASFLKDSSFRKAGIIGRASQVQEVLLKEKKFVLSYGNTPTPKSIDVQEAQLEKTKAQVKELESQKKDLKPEEEERLEKIKAQIEAMNKDIERLQSEIIKFKVVQLEQTKSKSKELETQKIKFERQKRTDKQDFKPEEEESLKAIKAQIGAINKDIQLLQSEILKLKKDLPLLSEVSLEILKSTNLALKYKQAHEDEEAANLFNTYGVSEENFNYYLELKKRAKNSDAFIPPVFIEGKDFGLEGCYVVKLSKDDPKGPLLGNITACCQRLGGQGQKAAEHGILSEDGGFYVFCKGKPPRDKQNRIDTKQIQPRDILAQCWAWRGKDGAIVFDSIESQPNIRAFHENIRRIVLMTAALAQELTQKYHVPQVNVGTGGETLTTIGYQNTIASEPLTPSGYTDAHQQREVSNSKLPLYAKSYFDPVGALKDYYHLTAQEKARYDIGLIAKIAANNTSPTQFDLFLKELELHGVNRKEFLNQSLVLLHSIRVGNNTLATYLIDNGSDVNQENDVGTTPLILAAKTGNAALANLLVMRGAEVDKADSRNKTPLMFAMLNGSQAEPPEESHKNIVRLLVKHGADVIRKSNSLDAGASIDILAPERHIIVDCLREAILGEMIRKNDKFNKEQFGSIAFGTMSPSSPEELSLAKQWLTAWTRKVTTENQTLEKLDPLDNPIWDAVALGFTDIVEELLNKGTDINTKNAGGKTLLEHSLERKTTDTTNKEMALLVLSKGIKSESKVITHRRRC